MQPTRTFLISITYLLIILFQSFNTFNLQAQQEKRRTDSLQVLFFIEKGDSLSGTGRIKASIQNYREAENLYSKINMPREREENLYNLIYNLIYLGNAQKEISSLLDTFQLIHKNYLPQDTGLLIRYYILRGLDSFFNQQYQESASYLQQGLTMVSDTNVTWRFQITLHRYLALSYERLYNFDGMKTELEKALSIEKKDGRSEKKMAWDRYYLSTLYYSYLGQREKAIQYALMALKGYQQYPPDVENIFRTYTLLGYYYQNQDDLGRAREYFRQAEHISSEDKNLSQSMRVIYYRYMANWHLTLQEYDAARTDFENFMRQVKIAGQKIPVTVYIAMSTTYFNLGDTLQSLQMAQRAVTSARQPENNPGGYALISALNNLSQRYLSIHEPDKVLPLLHEALTRVKRLYPYKQPRIAYVCSSLAQYFHTTGHPDSALYYIQQAMIYNIQDFNDPDIFSNPERLNAFNKVQLLNNLNSKADILADIAETSPQMDASMQTYHLAVSLIDSIRLSFRSDFSKTHFSAEIQHIMNSAVSSNFRFYHITHDEKYLEEAFYISEKNKAFDLLNAMRTRKAITFSGIPEETQHKEHRITQELGLLNERLYEGTNSETSDKVDVTMLEQGIFRLQTKLDSLLDDMEKRYPEYYNLKYNTSVITPTQIKSTLPEDQALISYYYSDSTIFAFCFADRTLRTFSLDVDNTLQQGIYYLTQQFNKGPAQNKSQQDSIVRNLAYLEEKLISPFSQELINKSVLIIPDGLLNGIPFGLLITPPSQNHGDAVYAAGNPENYFIMHHPVAYTFSATLYFEKRQSNRNFINHILAMAPGYPREGLSLNLNDLRGQQGELTLYPLPYAREEIKEISRLTPGKKIYGNQATEASFKRFAPRYNLLHLSMHTVIDNENPLYSKLVFSPETDTLQDGLLNTWEIYGLSLNAELAVLSACNTGTGKIQEGEGMMSLARSFKYAGVPSLVTSLWEVEDKSGAELMERFYHNLRLGMKTDVALQKAKQYFLSEAHPSKQDPYFWAAYTLIGQPQRIFHPVRNLIVLLALILTTGIVIQVRRKRRRTFT